MIKRWLFQLGLVVISCLPLKAQNWQGLQTGVNYEADKLFSDTVDNVLYLTGNFTTAGPVSVLYRAKWNGNAWDTIPGQNDLGWQWFYRIDGILYATGSGVYQWTGSNWVTIGNTSYGSIRGLIKYNNELIAYGQFDTIDGIAASKVAKWDGTNWSALGSTDFQQSSVALDAAVYNGELYIGGNIISSDNTIRELAKWDGNNWSKVGTGLHGTGAIVRALTVYNNELYIGGGYSFINGAPSMGIMKWDGNVLTEVGGGLSGTSCYPQLWDMTVYNGYLYAVGCFDQAGGVQAQNIAKWNGEDWCSLGSQFDNTILSVEVYNDELYVAGGFIAIDGDTVNRVAKWTGGTFVSACGNTTGQAEQQETNLTVTVYPNPFNTSATFEITGMSESVTLCVFDQLGREVKRVEGITNGTHEFNREGLSSGFYYYFLQNEAGRVVSGKIVIQ